MNRSQTLKDLDKILPPEAYLAFFNVGPVEGETRQHRWFKKLKRTAKRLADIKDTSDKRISKADELSQFISMRYAFNDITANEHVHTFDWTAERATAWILSRYATVTAETAAELTEVMAEVQKDLEKFGDGPWTFINSSKPLLATRPKAD